MPLAQPKEKQDHGLHSPGLGLDKPCLTLDYSRSHGIALALGLAWALVLSMAHSIAKALALAVLGDCLAEFCF